jgi:hypothetical protein
MKNGFNPALAYNVIFTAKDPYVLGIGFAALRDVASFFKYELHDDRAPQTRLPEKSLGRSAAVLRSPAIL